MSRGRKPPIFQIVFCLSHPFNQAQSTETIKASDIFWFGFEGYSQSDADSMYMLMGSGFFAAERDLSAEQLTNEWIKDHPNATVTIVNEISEDNDPTFKWKNRYLKESKYPGVYMYQSPK